MAGMVLTFEDRRKENFEKGQAELERRRAMLRDQQQKDEMERLAAEKTELEKKERIRYSEPSLFAFLRSDATFSTDFCVHCVAGM